MRYTIANQIYDKFRQIAGQEIDQKARAYVSKAGPGSICSRNPDWCYKFEKEDIERSLRSERMVVVAQGDLKERRIDRLLLVDYDTEAILLEMDPHSSNLTNAAWRFSIGLVPAMSTSAGLNSPETQDQPTAVTSTKPEPSSNRPAVTGNGNITNSGSNTPISSDIPPTRIRVPGKVTAAAIISQTRPQYPPQARAGYVHGDVVLHAIIDKEGKISELQVLSGDDMLEQSPLEAVRL